MSSDNDVEHIPGEEVVGFPRHGLGKHSSHRNALRSSHHGVLGSRHLDIVASGRNRGAVAVGDLRLVLVGDQIDVVEVMVAFVGMRSSLKRIGGQLPLPQVFAYSENTLKNRLLTTKGG